MRGTERAEVARQLTVVGWLLLGGPLGFLAFQLDRVRRVSTAGDAFGGVWDQRIEVLSFLMLPPNLVVLAPPVIAAAVATWLAGDECGPWLVTLLRVAAGLAIGLAIVGAVSIVDIAVNDDDNLEGVFLRLGGISMAAGMAWLCRTADVASTS